MVKKAAPLPDDILRFIEPMYAAPVRELPYGKEWMYEVKFDGYRASLPIAPPASRCGHAVGTVLTLTFQRLPERAASFPPIRSLTAKS
ncbi:MAG TPA: hypothetical protein VHV54_18030 [Candidatus Binatia bacterium]|nr:hypothetical protein [Candidatus Binatia bacterium]